MSSIRPQVYNSVSSLRVPNEDESDSDKRSVCEEFRQPPAAEPPSSKRVSHNIRMFDDISKYSEVQIRQSQ